MHFPQKNHLFIQTILLLPILLFTNSCSRAENNSATSESRELPGLINPTEEVNPARKKVQPIAQKTIKAAPASVGTNLAAIGNFSTQLPFLNHFKIAKPWFTQCRGKKISCAARKWDTKESELLNLDENGWVKSFPSTSEQVQFNLVSTVLFRGMANKYPGGKYIVLYDGEGTLEYDFAGQKIASESRQGRDVINVDSSQGRGLLISIKATDPNKTGNYIRNIRVVEAKYESLLQQGEIFNPLFLEKIKPFNTIRFMDWMNTNGSNQQEWQKRSLPENATYSHRAPVPIEVMVALANKQKQNAWFNMPHKATDEYMRNFAQLVKRSLDPDLKIYLEYSNEVWNWAFRQTHYAKDQAVAKWGEGNKTYLQWYGMRTAQMCNIWKEVFAGEEDRVVCVISTHTAVRGAEKYTLDCPKWVEMGNKPCYQHGIDAYAITGYFGRSLGQPENQEIVQSWIDSPASGVPAAFEQLKNGGLFNGKKQASLKQTYELFQYHSKVAQERNLQLVAYEGGQHIVAKRKLKNNQRLNNFFHELNRHPEMYTVYTQLLNDWQRAGGGLFMHFSDVREHDKHGSWGALEYLGQPNAPKYNALIDFINKNQANALDN